MAAARKPFLPWVWLQLGSKSYHEYCYNSEVIHTMTMAATRKPFFTMSIITTRNKFIPWVWLQLGSNSYHEYGCNSEAIHTMSIATTRKLFIPWVWLQLGSNSYHEYDCNSEAIHTMSMAATRKQFIPCVLLQLKTIQNIIINTHASVGRFGRIPKMYVGIAVHKQYSLLDAIANYIFHFGPSGKYL